MQAPPPSEEVLWKVATVHVDCHVAVDRHLYSVPHALVGRRCRVRLSASLIEISCGGRCVAIHRRGHRPGGYTTDPDHLPRSCHRRAAWTPERLLAWAAQTGPATARLAERILARHLHPEHGYRGCLALIGLGRRVGPEPLERACRLALLRRAHTYRAVKTILERDLHALPDPSSRHR